MKTLMRWLIALLATGVVWAGPAFVAQAAKTVVHEAAVATDIADIGFLDFKTFLIGPSANDDPALASERMRLVSPESLLYDRARTWTPDPLAGQPDPLSSVLSKRRKPDPGADALIITVDGAPVTLRLGLRDAMLRDLRENFRLYGVPGLFNPMPGTASARYIGNAAKDVIQRIDSMEDAIRDGTFAHHQPLREIGSGDARFAGPSSLPLFAFGLLVMAWLRRPRHPH